MPDLLRRDRNAEKVAVIGWHRTGTTSLHVALQQLGYRVHGFDMALSWRLMKGDLSPIWKAARRADAFRDFPWSLLYRELADRYPRARFVLTERDPDDWFESYTRHHDTVGANRLHTWLYGVDTPHGNAGVHIARYRRHNDEVRAHFAGSDRLLVFDAFGGDGWRELCAFLGKPVPPGDFPDEKSAVL